MRNQRPGDFFVLHLDVPNRFGDSGARVELPTLSRSLRVDDLRCLDRYARTPRPLASDNSAWVVHVVDRGTFPWDNEGFQGSSVPFDLVLAVRTNAPVPGHADVVIDFISRSGGRRVHRHTETIAIGMSPHALSLRVERGALSVGGAPAPLIASYGPVDVTASATFTSLDPALCTVNGAMATPVAAGTARIRVAYSAVTTDLAVEIVPAALQLDPPGPYTLLSGEVRTVTLTGTLPSGPRDYTAVAAWRTTDPRIVTASPGKLEARGRGAAEVEVVLGDTAARLPVAVIAIAPQTGRDPLERVLDARPFHSPLIPIHRPATLASRNPAVVRVLDTSRLQTVAPGATELVARDALGQEKTLAVHVFATPPPAAQQLATLLADPATFTVAATAHAFTIDAPAAGDAFEALAIGAARIGDRAIPIGTQTNGRLAVRYLADYLQQLGVIALHEAPDVLVGVPIELHLTDRFGRSFVTTTTVG